MPIRRIRGSAHSHREEHATGEAVDARSIRGLKAAPVDIVLPIHDGCSGHPGVAIGVDVLPEERKGGSIDRQQIAAAYRAVQRGNNAHDEHARARQGGRRDGAVLHDPGNRGGRAIPQEVAHDATVHVGGKKPIPTRMQRNAGDATGVVLVRPHDRDRLSNHVVSKAVDGARLSGNHRVPPVRCPNLGRKVHLRVVKITLFTRYKSAIDYVAEGNCRPLRTIDAQAPRMARAATLRCPGLAKSG